MPIAQFLDSSEFDAETRRVIGVAFEMARAALRPGNQGDLVNEAIAGELLSSQKLVSSIPIFYVTLC